MINRFKKAVDATIEWVNEPVTPTLYKAIILVSILMVVTTLGAILFGEYGFAIYWVLSFAVVVFIGNILLIIFSFYEHRRKRKITNIVKI